ncbi:hypothetical protein ACVBEQ_28015, partial [Nakamurella sp. GG22]
MTSTTPRPMQTPDLAGLLGKPARRPRPDPEPSAVDADDVPVGEHTQDPPVAKDQTPVTVTTTPAAQPPTSPPAPATPPQRPPP